MSDQETTTAPGTKMTRALMDLNEELAPIHDWLAGERAYFLSQGYTDDEARAMAAATFVCLFGACINRS